MKGSRRRVYLLLLLVVVLTGSLIYGTLFHGGRKQIFLIGLAGPMSGPFSEVGISMRRGVELAITHVNQSGELGPITLEARIEDDQSNLADNQGVHKAAEHLARNANLLGVVGHYFSNATLEASPIYDALKIPLITPSATNPKVTALYPGNFSLIPDDFYQAVFLANYVLHGLDQNKIAIINTSNLYGESLRDYFIKELKINAVEPVADIAINPEKFDPDPLERGLGALGQASAVFLAMNYTNAAHVIKYIKNKGLKCEFIGGESLGGPHFIRLAGIYSEDVYAVTPFLPNLLGEKAKRYQDDFVQTFQTNPDWVATHAYEAVMLFAHAIRKGGADRVAIRTVLSKILDEEDAVESITGPIYFNEEGASRKRIAIGQVKEGRHAPARFQFSNARYPELVKARGAKSNAFMMNGRFVKRTTVVFTGLHVKEIKDFDPIGGSFTADFLLWFRWDPTWNAKLNFEMTYGKVLSAQIREKYFDPENNFNFISYDVSAQMEGIFPLQEYPFDEQELQIRIKPKVQVKEDLILVTDIADDSFLRNDLSLKSWTDVKHFQFTGEKDTIWSYRNPKYKKKLFEMEHSQFDYHILLRRNWEQYTVKLLPLLVMVLMAYSQFFVNYEYVGSRFSLGILALLTAMSFHNVNKIDVGYLVRADIFFMMTYYLIFLTIIETVVTSSFFIHGNKIMANRIDIASIVLYPVLMLGAIIHLFR
ncbi:MAG: ABC transporter substrate-binding protein [Magnetococcales bacterium]|nr:ABC transporter substrate-binding protein [Magnetococcales bacterium]